MQASSVKDITLIMKSADLLCGAMLEKCVTLQLVEVENKAVVSRITFTRSLTKQGIEAEKWMTPFLWQELQEKMQGICEVYMDKNGKKKVDFFESKTLRTENLTLSYRFEPTLEAYKAVFPLVDENQAEDTKRLELLDHVLVITASLKREHKYLNPPASTVTSQIAEKKPQIAAKNAMSSPLRVLQPKADKKEIPAASIMKANFVKSPLQVTSTVTKKNSSKDDKNENLNKKNRKTKMLSLKNKDGSSRQKNQPSITSFLVKTPPSEKPKSEGRSSKESSPELPVKRRLDEKFFDEPSSPPKVQKTDYLLQEVIDVPDTPKTPASQISSFPFLDGGDEEETVKKLLTELRSPMKLASPVSKENAREDQAIVAFPNPESDPQYIQDCKILQQAFETGDIESLSEEVLQRMFDTCLPYLEAIWQGRIFNQRHNEYHEHYQNRNTMEYISGCDIFSSKSLTFFVAVLGTTFTNNKIENARALNYLIKILIPELIIKIVMGVYKLDKKAEALQKMHALSIGMIGKSCLL